MSERISGALGGLYLTVCGVLEKTPSKEFLEKMDWEQVFSVVAAHNLTAITGICVERAVKEGFLLYEEQEKVYKKWIELKNKAVRKNILLDAERKELEDYFEQQKIWYMPLKGVLLKEMYPQSSMRQMADNDILFDDAYAESVRDFLSSKGYRIESFGQGNHDVYLKNPVYNFEMHRSLYSDSHKVGWKEYYKDVKKKLLQVTEYKYAFSDEDFYIYLISHAYKHHSGCGTGLRTLTDVFVCLQKLEEKMDWSYILEQCNILGIDEYEEQTRLLAKKVFSKEHLDVSAGQFGSSLIQSLSQEERQLLEYLFGSGTYGNMENWIGNQLQKYEKQGSGNAKLSYLCKRLFPEMSYYKENYPFLYRHKWLIPGFVVYRMGRGIILRGKNILAEFRTVLKK